MTTRKQDNLSAVKHAGLYQTFGYEPETAARRKPVKRSAAKKKSPAKKRPPPKKAPAKRKAAPKAKAKRGPSEAQLEAMAQLRANPYMFFRQNGAQRTRSILHLLPIAQVRKWAKTLNITRGTKKSELDAIIKLMETETENARQLLTKAVPAIKDLRGYLRKFRKALKPNG